MKVMFSFKIFVAIALLVGAQVQSASEKAIRKEASEKEVNDDALIVFFEDFMAYLKDNDNDSKKGNKVSEEQPGDQPEKTKTVEGNNDKPEKTKASEDPEKEKGKAKSAGSVDVETILGKNMVGYQGWFTCSEEGIAQKHWFEDGHVQMEMLPDVSEYDENDLCTLPEHFDKNGKPIKVFSSESPGVVNTHFKWMQEYDIDGAFVQEFLTSLSETKGMERRLKVTTNVKNAAEEYGRAWAVMFDLSKAEQSPLEAIKKALDGGFSDLIKNSPMYLKQNGKPLVAIWGIGDDESHLGDPEEALEIVELLNQQGFSAYAGFAGSKWKTELESGDSEWEKLVESFDVVSPWTVGSESSPDEFEKKVKEEIELLQGKDVIYTPVVYPGFSWTNLQRGEGKKFNDKPRNGGDFMLGQAKAAIAGGARTIYTAMFDEVNEATSIFKTLATEEEHPTKGKFLALDADGKSYPSDHYLTVSGQISELVRQGN
jgi:hypothetical protein